MNSAPAEIGNNKNSRKEEEIALAFEKYQLARTRVARHLHTDRCTYWDQDNDSHTPVIVTYEIDGIRELILRSVVVDMPGEKGPCVLNLLSENEIGEIEAALCERHEWRDQA